MRLFRLFVFLAASLLCGCGKQLGPRVYIDIVGDERVDIEAMDVYVKKIGFKEAPDSPFWHIDENGRSVSYILLPEKIYFGYGVKFKYNNEVKITILDYSTEYCKFSPQGEFYVQRLISFMRDKYRDPKFIIKIRETKLRCRGIQR